MVSIGGVIQSLLSNWVTIVVTTLATGVTLYVSRRYQTNAREERLNQAKESVISIVEEHVIDDKELNMGKFDDLITAAERENSVALVNNVNKISLLQDLELKIEKSPHLNSEQKQKYTNQIQEYISEIEEQEQVPKVSRERQEIIESLSDNIKTGDKEDALADLDALEDEISELEKRPSAQVYRRKNYQLFYRLILVIALFISWFSIISRLFSLPDFNPSQLITISFVILIMLYSYLYMRKS